MKQSLFRLVDGTYIAPEVVVSIQLFERDDRYLDRLSITTKDGSRITVDYPNIYEAKKHRDALAESVNNSRLHPDMTLEEFRDYLMETFKLPKEVFSPAFPQEPSPA